MAKLGKMRQANSICVSSTFQQCAEVCRSVQNIKFMSGFVDLVEGALMSTRTIQPGHNLHYCWQCYDEVLSCTLAHQMREPGRQTNLFLGFLQYFAHLPICYPPLTQCLCYPQLPPGAGLPRDAYRPRAHHRQLPRHRVRRAGGEGAR